MPLRFFILMFEVTPSTNTAGANIWQWPFVGHKEQLWTIQANKNGLYSIKSLHGRSRCRAI